MALVEALLSMSPGLAAAISAVLAAGLTALVTNRKNAADLALDMVREQRAEVKSLKERVTALEKRLDDERAAHAGTAKSKRVVEEKYSVAIVYIGETQTRATFHGWDLPDVPDLIKRDMPPST